MLQSKYLINDINAKEIENKEVMLLDLLSEVEDLVYLLDHSLDTILSAAFKVAMETKKTGEAVVLFHEYNQVCEILSNLKELLQQ